MKKVYGVNAKKQAVVMAVISAVMLMGGGSAWAVPEIPSGRDYLPDNATCDGHFRTGYLSKYYPKLLIMEGKDGGWLEVSGGLYYDGSSSTELTLNSDVIMDAVASSRGIGWDGSYKSFTNNGTLNAYGSDNNAGFVNSTSFINNGQVNATGASSGSAGFSMSPGSEVINAGTFTFKVEGENGDGGQMEGNFTNRQTGVVNITGGTGAKSRGFYASHGNIVNDGTFNITGGVGTNAYGFYLNDGYEVSEVSAAARAPDLFIPHATLDNTGTINVTGGKGTGYGFYQLSDVTNTGTVATVGGNADDQGLGANGWYMASGTFNNSGTLLALGGNYQDAYGFYNEGGTVVNDVNGVVRNDKNRSDTINGGSFYQKAGSFTNKGSMILVSGNGKSIGFNQAGGSFVNESGATMDVSGSTYEAVYGYVLGNNATFNNSGTLTSIGGSGSQSHGFYQVGGTFTNSGTLKAIASNSDPTADETAAFMLEGGNLINEVGGIIKVTGCARNDGTDYAFQLGSAKAVVTNSGSFDATASGANSMAVSIYGGTFTNSNGGRITVVADGADSIGIDFDSGSIENKILMGRWLLKAHPV